MLKECRIKNFPVSFFSVVMGLSGLAISLQKATEIYGISNIYSNLMLAITVVIFGLLGFFYIRKMISCPSEVKKEFKHPIKINFFPAISISFLLLSVAYLPVSMAVSKYLWIIGASSHLILTLSIITSWIQHKVFEVKHMNPSWFIPAVGNILVPIAGVTHAPVEISWLFFSAGIFFWIILLVLFFNRVFFHDPLPGKLLPTLFILIAPPAVGFIAYFKLTDNFNDFARILYYFGMFIVLLLFFQVKMLSKIKFYLSWWAYSFPLSAAAISNAMMYHITKVDLFKNLFLFFLIILGVLIVVLSIKTIASILRKEICVEED
ncbi:MAG: SLAC1 anion channel family protein [Patescibacteria group bacterium]|jgi:tellurite resistance protein|nr:SLAC1 anion channel family protein [Patescibacteria group bacterium]